MELVLPPNLKEFLQLLKDKKVRYLLMGGYAVGYHGYPRATGDMDIWVAIEPDNAARLVAAMREFSFDLPALTVELFLKEKSIVQMGAPPMCIEVVTTISGVNFEACYAAQVVDELDRVEVSLINLEDLERNKNDLEHL